MSRIGLLILLFLTIGHIHCQTTDYSISRISSDQGLSQNTINCILQDSRGFIWFGTKDGLNKYDGSKFKVYKNSPGDSLSISDNYIYSFDEDRNGNIWIGTRKGLNKFDIRSETFISYENDPFEPYSIADDIVFGVESGEKGFIWCKTEKSLSRLDTNLNQFVHFEHYVDYFNVPDEDHNLPIQEDKGGVWFGTNDGLYYFDKIYEQFIRFVKDEMDSTSILGNTVNSLLIDKLHRLWVGTDEGLCILNAKGKTFSKVYLPDNEISHSISSIYEDNLGNIWIGTELGDIFKYGFKKRVITEVNVFDPDDKGLILSLYSDNSKNLWVGSEYSGISKIDTKGKIFNKFSLAEFSAKGRLVTAVYKDVKGQILLGTYDGLFIYDRYNNGNYRKICDHEIYCIYEDRDNLLFVGTDRGIIIYTIEDGVYVESDVYSELKKVRSYINTIIEDRYGDVWVATKNGIYKYSKEKNKLSSFKKKVNYNKQDSLSLSSNHVFSLLEDLEGNIWFGNEYGMDIYNSRTNTITRCKNNILFNSLSNVKVYEIFEDSKGTIWFGTSDGLKSFNSLSSMLISHSIGDLASNHIIYEIQEDNVGSLWMSTNEGLVKYNKEQKSFRCYNIEDGLQGKEFINGSSYKAMDGELFYGGFYGFNTFYPDSINENANIPPVLITSIETIGDNGKTMHYREGTTSYEVSYKEHTLLFRFAALEYTSSNYNQYKYRLEGLNEGWIDNGNLNFVSFSNLLPGEYVFHVKGSNNNQVWNHVGAKVVINIKPPIWMTPLAITLYIIISVTLIYYIIKVRTRQLRAANEVLREKQLASLEIEKQKEILTIKNTNITDSINYAKRIQEAMLPSEYLFKKLLPDSFILYKPKDIVSGDFYWVTERNDKIFVAAVDCTGHGVPGAFMSIIGFDLLRAITKERGVENPAQILNNLNAGLSEAFSKRGDSHQVKDGMDMALCVINKKTKLLEFAGAINPIYLIRDNNIIEIKGNRFSIGRVDKDEFRKFETHSIPLKRKDMIYLFSDGYPDQFGGPLGKKFKYGRFRHLLLTIHNLPVEKQKTFLNDNIENWKGALEQVDDIIVIGTRI